MGTNQDWRTFDAASASSDPRPFVLLLASQEPVGPFEERMHHWAEDPRTVGALAASHLAAMASSSSDKALVKDAIREAGAIPPLVDFLQSKEEDRVQAAVVALSFLTGDCSANALAAYQSGALPLLMRQLQSSLAGKRSAAATALRNLCVESEGCRRQFVESGGLVALVNQIGRAADNTVSSDDVQLEALLNLQDILEDGEGNIIEAYARIVIEAGVEKRARQLLQCEDDEVRTCAQDLLATLASRR